MINDSMIGKCISCLVINQDTYMFFYYLLVNILKKELKFNV